jgi:hypothetical protein
MSWVSWRLIWPLRVDIPPPGSLLPKRGEIPEDLPPPDLPPNVHEWSTLEVSLVLGAVLLLISAATWLRRRSIRTN